MSTSLKSDGRQFGQADVRRHTLAFCAANPKWKPIFEIDDSALYTRLPWVAQPGFVRKPWHRYRPSACEAWQEFSTFGMYRFRTGFVSGAGDFYWSICDVPWAHNSCMVIEVGGRPGLYYDGQEYDARGNKIGERRLCATTRKSNGATRRSTSGRGARRSRRAVRTATPSAT